jgi:Tfp pilus assembly protein PilO
MPRHGRFDIRQAARRILLILVAAGALDGAFYLLRVQPRLREYEQLRQEIQPVLDELDEIERRVQSQEEFLAAVRRAEQDLGRLREEILSTRELRLVEVQRELARLAAQFHINLERVGFSNELLEEEDLDRLVMDVPLEGGYDNLRRFLHAVERSDKFLVVEGVTLAKGKEGGALLSLNITLATYFNAPEGLAGHPRGGARRERRDVS